MTAPTCSACSGTVVPQNGGASKFGSCDSCGGVHSMRPVFKGDFPFDLFRLQVEPAAETRYFDISWIDQGAGEVVRTHGWFDVDTRTVVQVG